MSHPQVSLQMLQSQLQETPSEISTQVFRSVGEYRRLVPQGRFKENDEKFRFKKEEAIIFKIGEIKKLEDLIN